MFWWPLLTCDPVHTIREFKVAKGEQLWENWI
jgi:hypothetical protein